MARDPAQRLAELAIEIPKILIPAGEIDLTSWAVIACDQFTSQPDYWRRVEASVGARPSTLRLFLPEIYLEESNVEDRLRKIRGSMADYLARGFLTELPPGFMLVRRSTPYASARWGIVAALDLERYEYRPGSTALVRATEETIEARIPPRTRIRDNAPIELPHIMVLYDDPSSLVLDPLIKDIEGRTPTYDADLMLGSGHIAGYLLSAPEELSAIAEAFEHIRETARRSSVASSGDPLLFAVGDGNHALAAAKTVWERVKASPGASDAHPARYALVELVNVHDAGLHFEPIHRVIFRGGRGFLERLRGGDFELRSATGIKAIETKLDADNAQQLFGAVDESGAWIVRRKREDSTLIAAAIQQLIDRFLAENPNTSVDYVHGAASACELGRKPGNLALLLPRIERSTFFPTVDRDGSFPRKTFSMGEAEEKRFYLECRRLFS